MDESLAPHLGLEDLRWLQRLARQLVKDPDEADDVVQDTVLAALTRAPERVSAPRGWLGMVLRNVVRQGRRGAARRTAREREREVRDETRSTAEVVEELAWHRTLVDRVNALAEPYRTTIVLRFLRGRSPREIAREQDIPVKTVHTRIERGLALLRLALDRGHGGDRNAWIVGLLPLTRSKGGALGLLSGAALVPMNLKLITAGAAVIALLSTIPFVLRDAPDLARDAGLPVEVARTEAGALEPILESLPAPQAEERAMVTPLSEEPEADLAPTPEAPWLVRGTVRGLDGATIADVAVFFERVNGRFYVRDPAFPAARSNAGGEFALSFPPDIEGPGRLAVDDPFWAAISRPYVGERGDAAGAEALLVVLAPKREYAGRVLAPDGAPVEGATVVVSIDGDYLRSYDVAGSVVNVRTPISETRTGADGSFVFDGDGVGFVEDAHVEAVRDGFGPARVPLPDVSDKDLTLVLTAATELERAVHGLVLEESGAPVAGAVVSLGRASVETGPAGEFAIELESWSEGGTLRAAKRGLGATTVGFAWDGPGPGRSADEPLTLFITSQAHSIRGRLVDADGAPVEGALVYTPDTTYFGEVDHLMGETTLRGGSTIEALLAGRVGPWKGTVDARTDANGQFELTHLMNREYAVFAMREATLEFVGPVSGHPGRGPITLVLAPDETCAVAGRIVTPDGTPLAGVRVTVRRAVPWQRPERPADPWDGSPIMPPDASRAFGSRAETDAEGLFSIEGIAIKGVALSFAGPSVFLPRPVSLADESDPSNLEVVLQGRSTFRLALIDPLEADAYHLETEGGKFQPLFVQVEQARLSTAKVPFVDGFSGAAYTSAGEHTAVLLKDGETVRKARIVLPLGGVHQLEL